jgi:transposase-like protein
MPGKTHRIGPSLIETARIFATEEACHEYLQMARWPNGVCCLKCDHDKVSKFQIAGKTRTNKKGIVSTGPTRFMYQCLKCKYQFSTTTGTIFSDTHLPLSKWMLAVAIMCNAKKSVSAKQMERDMGVSYKTAWFLNHRIRKAMESPEGLFSGTVEIDATFIGGKYDERRARAKYGKQAVAGVMQRTTDGQPSQVMAFPVQKEIVEVMTGVIRDHVSTGTHIMTDDHGAYRGLSKNGWKHEIVCHTQDEWVRGNVHTQGIESFWSLFKRGVIGSFHSVSVKHLDRYLSEFCFRFNSRRDEQIFAAVITGLVIGSALRYKVLTGPTDAEMDALEVSE